jgi:DNA (cytosine-5)-methyltransferase 1
MAEWKQIPNRETSSYTIRFYEGFHRYHHGEKMITIGSLFSGIGGFELGLERAIPNAKTIWQCEQNEFCRKVLRKHWPDATIYEDIRKMDTQDVPFVDLMCGGFPCQDISICGKGEGLDGKKSSLWWSMLGCISRLRPSVIVLENVPAITFRGGIDVVGSITQLGYDCEWGIIPAGGPQGFGAPHIRKRWFLIGYIANPKGITFSHRRRRTQEKKTAKTRKHPEFIGEFHRGTDKERLITNPNRRPKSNEIQTGREEHTMCNYGNITYHKRNYWQGFPTQSPLCRRDDGVSYRVDRRRLIALGNAIVPQCSEYIGQCIMKAGLL